MKLTFKYISQLLIMDNDNGYELDANIFFFKLLLFISNIIM